MNPSSSEPIQPERPTPPKAPLTPYTPKTGVFDEAFDESGKLRPIWETLSKDLKSLGPAELQHRLDQAQRQIARDGFTFNPYDQDGGASRPWTLDAIPLLMHEQEWQNIEAGLAQRAELFDLILKDLYGPQQLLKEKHLPPEVLFGHPAYYPAYHNLHQGEHGFLHLYAADLARSEDGLWWVVADRSRAPFGLGYVLENRIVTSRMLPTAFRQCHVQRLASFFIALKDSLRERASRFTDNPRVVIWSKGPQSKAYFEDAYLARYLGYQLVEGGDLAVRENRVALKTLGGLLPIEVIFRRLEDDDCDPVELNAGSISGVAGLMEVLRAENVAIANPLGSRLVESPLFMAFLPSICEELLGEPLKMPSVATWWCGEEEECKYVLEHLDELIIRKAFRKVDEPPLRPAEMSKADRETLRNQIRSRPSDYVGQETVNRSTTPVWSPNGTAPWPLALRSFLVRSGGKYTGLPGGLARVAKESNLLEQYTTTGERSQDVWVLSDKSIEEVSLLSPPGQMMTLRRSGAELPSRVADNLFWLGRSIEQAEGSARLLRTLLVSVTSEDSYMVEQQALLRALVEQGQIDPDYVIPELTESLPRIETMLPQAIFDTNHSKSLRSSIIEAMRLISIVRDRMSIDAWRIVQRIDELSRRKIGNASDVIEFLDRVILDLVAFSGLAAESMTRTQGWRFLDLGRRVERAHQTAMLLKSTLTTIHDEEQPVLEAVLEVADSIMTYRNRYLATLQAGPVIDLLLNDETNPRSIAYQMVAIAKHVENLPRDEKQATLDLEQRIALSLLNRVRLAEVHELVKLDRPKQRLSLDKLLTEICDDLPRLADTMSSRFLIHAGLPRHFGSIQGESA
ncbi:circularly permuted type 2 ATP-grasp protein [Planctomicrobium sp. SH527]|uniref:circularly permuted type 2 ATP-grasp protein n=1 Tax=Planctomicrobium sp. SH527 TaxID=3448123 RepID=UPI003F5C5784